MTQSFSWEASCLAVTFAILARLISTILAQRNPEKTLLSPEKGWIMEANPCSKTIFFSRIGAKLRSKFIFKNLGTHHVSKGALSCMDLRTSEFSQRCMAHASEWFLERYSWVSSTTKHGENLLFFSPLRRGKEGMLVAGCMGPKEVPG